MAEGKKQAPLVSVITVNYHTETYVKKLLTLLGKNPQIEVIVVDNSPPHINKGFATANNSGMHQAQGEWLLLLNSDTEVTGEKVLEFVKKVQESGYRAGAAKLVYPDESAQKSAGYFDSFFQNPVNYLFARPRFVNPHENTKVDFAIGACLLLHRSLMTTVGVLDEHFFMYFEDLDYGLRLKDQHIPILYVTDITITHHEGAAAKQNVPQKNINYQQSLHWYLQKHRGSVITFINSIFHFLR